MAEHLELTSRYGMRTEQFSDLMAFRVREVLLVASQYDAFVLEEDGQLAELVVQEYRSLDLYLPSAPRFTRAQSGAEAAELLAARSFDMVVTSARLPDMEVETFGRLVKGMAPGLAVGVLVAHAWEIPRVAGLRESGAVDWIFLWQGDVTTLLALFRQVEDRRNADHDVLEAGVQAIILVEDDIRFFSFYLPHMYTEVTQQTGRLMAEGLNLSHRLLRIRARPKVLLACSLEEAWALFERYHEQVLGVISDVVFPRGERLDPEAGFELVRRIRTSDDEMPVLLQSSDASKREQAAAAGAVFAHKDSPRLLEEMRRFMVENFGFGDFVFRLPSRVEVIRATTLRELLHRLEEAPEASIEYHASHNHFSRWLKARSEFELAAAIRRSQVSDFASISELRRYLSATMTSYLREIQRHVISDFDPASFDEFVAFARIGSGSLGGKGRGLAFMQKLLAQDGTEVAGVDVAIPQTVVVASDVFEEFLDENNLRGLVREAAGMSDAEILDTFRRGRFPHPRRAALASLLEKMRAPLAVRSSSILEDSLYQPFAGVYATVMLPNGHPSLDVRLAQLLEGIKVVYASTYMRAARDYLETTPHRIEEERMAVLLQRLVGRPHGDAYYPTFSGVASSHNFYPFRDMKHSDGVALVAVGLGKSVVEGFEAMRFCPRFPRVLPQLSTVKDTLRNAQRRFWALDLARVDELPGLDLDACLTNLEITRAFADGAAEPVGSSYVPGNDAITTGRARGGVPLVTFAPVLKGQRFPLAAVLVRLLELAQEGIGVPVEIEFAVDLASDPDLRPTFSLLQVRPMVVEQVGRDVALSAADTAGAIVVSTSALGHGRIAEISDLLVVRPGLDRARTAEVAAILGRLNGELRAADRRCILIGPGRWGSQDPWLGIPVTWTQISTARAIVETDFVDLEVEPSQGSHFFHNLTSSSVAFLAVHRQQDGGAVDWDWLDAQPAMSAELGGAVRHLRLGSPVSVLVDGASNRGAVVRG
jgi:hypothetical protein